MRKLLFLLLLVPVGLFGQVGYYSNAYGDFTVTVNDSTKTLTVADAPFTLTELNLVNSIGYIIAPDDEVEVIDFSAGKVYVSGGVITLKTLEDDFAVNDTVVLYIPGPAHLNTSDSISIPSGADTTKVESFFTTNPFSIHYWYESLDNTDGTLALYGSNYPNDTAAYSLLWVDLDLDGSNDNPWTLSDTSKIVWGDAFPFDYLIQKFTKVSNTSGVVHYEGRRR